VDPGSWCLDPKLVEERITPRTKGIIAVHLYGHPADMDALAAIARKHGLWLVEDAAEAHFARYKGRTVGGLSDIAMFSFYGNKIITSGEGGALTLNDAKLEQRARLLRGQGMDPERRYFFPVIGYNYRLTNTACAILCAQLERRATIIEKRARIFREYAEGLRGIPGIGFQPVAKWAEPAQWLYCITVDDEYGCSRDELARRLKAVGIDTRPFFVPIHRLPPYQDLASLTPKLAHTDFLADRGLNLPTFPGLQDEDVARICSAIRTLRA
jgi:perosamine synthetase